MFLIVYSYKLVLHVSGIPSKKTSTLVAEALASEAWDQAEEAWDQAEEAWDQEDQEVLAVNFSVFFEVYRVSY